MPESVSTRLQLLLVVVLFGAALAVLLANAFAALGLPQREAKVRPELRAASEGMAAAAVPLLDGGSGSEALDRKLRIIANQALSDFPDIEGGFYLADRDRFSGAAFPGQDQGVHPPPERNDPPPRENAYIRVQARESLSLPPRETQINAYDVVGGHSRVLVLTVPVGTERPAPMVVWTMYRVSGPEQLSAQLQHYRLSVVLALGGIALALLLTMNLVRRSNRQRRDQERLRDELRRSEHLAALGKLLAGVAHEVRNPLAGIRSTVQLWERLPETSRTEDSMQAIIRAVDRLNDIVTRLLIFARADSSERQPFAVNSLVAETFKLIEAQADEHGVELRADLAEDLPPVRGSGGALRQVLLNLATNALQAMPSGGRLTCSTRFQPKERTVIIRIADSGPGIAPDGRRHLFEPFFTTRPDGTGLGLALCREIVLQHGGTIELESGPDSGAVFGVTLPADQEGGAGQ